MADINPLHHDPLKALDLGKKLGPLPRGAWIGIGGVAIVGVVYYRSRSTAATTAAAPTASDTSTPDTTDTTDAGQGSYGTGDSTGGADDLLGDGGQVASGGQPQVGIDGTDSGSVSGDLGDTNPSNPGTTNVYGDVIGSQSNTVNTPATAAGKPAYSVSKNALGQTVHTYPDGHKETIKPKADATAAAHAAKNAPKPATLHPVHAAATKKQPLARKANPPAPPHATTHKATVVKRKPVTTKRK
jgi:hypothetical protein